MPKLHIIMNSIVCGCYILSVCDCPKITWLSRSSCGSGLDWIGWDDGRVAIERMTSLTGRKLLHTWLVALVEKSYIDSLTTKHKEGH